jgi:hypothetical protein
MPFPYDQIPSSADWTKDSKVFIGSRADDIVLTKIDELVAAYNIETLKPSRPEILYYLLKAVSYWIKKVK